MARLRRHGQNQKAAILPKITMEWLKDDMLNDDRIGDLIEAGVIGSSATKTELLEALYGL